MMCEPRHVHERYAHRNCTSFVNPNSLTSVGPLQMHGNPEIFERASCAQGVVLNHHTSYVQPNVCKSQVGLNGDLIYPPQNQRVCMNSSTIPQCLHERGCISGSDPDNDLSYHTARPPVPRYDRIQTAEFYQHDTCSRSPSGERTSCIQRCRTRSPKNIDPLYRSLNRSRSRSSTQQPLQEKSRFSFRSISRSRKYMRGGQRYESSSTSDGDYHGSWTNFDRSPSSRKKQRYPGWSTSPRWDVSHNRRDDHVSQRMLVEALGLSRDIRETCLRRLLSRS